MNNFFTELKDSFCKAGNKIKTFFTKIGSSVKDFFSKKYEELNEFLNNYEEKTKLNQAKKKAEKESSKEERKAKKEQKKTEQENAESNESEKSKVKNGSRLLLMNIFDFSYFLYFIVLCVSVFVRNKFCFFPHEMFNRFDF